MELGAPTGSCVLQYGLRRVYVTTRRHHGKLGAPAGADGAWCSGYSKKERRCVGKEVRRAQECYQEEDQQWKTSGADTSTRKEGTLHRDTASILNKKKAEDGNRREPVGGTTRRSTPVDETGCVDLLQEWVHESHSTKRCKPKATL
jgi:hypothetical protein